MVIGESMSEEGGARSSGNLSKQSSSIRQGPNLERLITEVLPQGDADPDAADPGNGTPSPNLLAPPDPSTPATPLWPPPAAIHNSTPSESQRPPSNPPSAADPLFGPAQSAGGTAGGQEPNSSQQAPRESEPGLDSGAGLSATFDFEDLRPDATRSQTPTPTDPRVSTPNDPSATPTSAAAPLPVGSPPSGSRAATPASASPLPPSPPPPAALSLASPARSPSPTPLPAANSVRAESPSLDVSPKPTSSLTPVSAFPDPGGDSDSDLDLDAATTLVEQPDPLPATAPAPALPPRATTPPASNTAGAVPSPPPAPRPSWGSVEPAGADAGNGPPAAAPAVAGGPSGPSPAASRSSSSSASRRRVILATPVSSGATGAAGASKGDADVKPPQAAVGQQGGQQQGPSPPPPSGPPAGAAASIRSQDAASSSRISTVQREMREKARSMLLLHPDTRTWLHVDKYGAPLRTPADTLALAGVEGGETEATLRERLLRGQAGEREREKERQRERDERMLQELEEASDWWTVVNVYRQSLWSLMTEPDSSTAAYLVSMLIVGTILLSTLGFVLATLPSYSEDRSPGSYQALIIIEAVTVQIFLADYVLRLISCPALLPFLVSPFNIIDLVSIVPWYVELALENSGMEGTAVFRVLRLLRVFRILKLGSRYRKLLVVTSSLARSVDMLLLMAFFVSLTVVAAASLMFFAERGTYDEALGYYVRTNEKFTTSSGQPIISPFESVPSGFWWAMVTLMTVGYGDVVPLSVGGRFIACATMLCGILAIAIPVAVIGANFSSAWEEYLRQQKAGAGTDVSPHLKVLSEVLGTHCSTASQLGGILKDATNRLADLRASFRERGELRREELERLLRQWRRDMTPEQAEAARTVASCLCRLGADHELSGSGAAEVRSGADGYALPPLLASLLEPQQQPQQQLQLHVKSKAQSQSGNGKGQQEQERTAVVAGPGAIAEGRESGPGGTGGGLPRPGSWETQQQALAGRVQALAQGDRPSRVAFAAGGGDDDFEGDVGGAAGGGGGLVAASSASAVGGVRGVSQVSRGHPSVSGLPTGVLMLRAISARTRPSARVAPAPTPAPAAAASAAYGGGGGGSGAAAAATAGVAAAPPAAAAPLPPSTPPTVQTPAIAVKHISGDGAATVATGAATATATTITAQANSGGGDGGGGGDSRTVSREAWGPEQVEEPQAEGALTGQLRAALAMLRGTPLHDRLIRELYEVLALEEEVHRQWTQLVRVLQACALMMGDYLPENLDVMRSQYRQLEQLGREVSDLHQRLEVLNDDLKAAQGDLDKGRLDFVMDLSPVLGYDKGNPNPAIPTPTNLPGELPADDAKEAPPRPSSAASSSSSSSAYRGRPLSSRSASGGGPGAEEAEEDVPVDFTPPPPGTEPPPMPPELVALAAMSVTETPVAEPLPRVSVLPSRAVSRAGRLEAPPATEL